MENENNDISANILNQRQNELKTEALQKLEQLKALDPAYIQQKQQQDNASQKPDQSTTDPFGRPVQKTNMTQQIVGGVTDALRENIQLMNDVSGVGKDGGSKPWLVIDFGKDQNDPVAQSYIDGDNAGKVPVVGWPKFETPQTTAQGIARGVAQFTTDFVAAGKILKPVKAVGTAAKTAKAMVQGAMTDFAAFDPHQERLSNLVQEFPVLQNPITAYLAADPNDSEAEGRFKNAIEGLGIGAGIDGFVQSVRTLRQVNLAKRAASGDSTAVTAFKDEITNEDLAPLGQIDSPVVTKINKAMSATETGVPDDVTAKGLVNITKKGTEDVYVNFAQINTGDDVKSVIAQTADAFSKDIDEAKRGVMTQEETAKLADDLGLTVEDLMARRKGQTFNAETAIAARRLWTASAEKLQELAKRASGANASDTDRFMFRKMLATHYAIQSEVIAGRTETARSLASWKIPVGGQERAKAIEDALNAFGGSDVTSELAKRIATLNSPQAIANMVQRSASARTLDAVKESFVMGLLWSPKTHIVNISSNTMVTFQQIYERKAAEMVSAFLGRKVGDGVAPGEAGSMYYGLRTSVADAFKYAYRALRTGEGGQALGKVDTGVEPAISAEALGIKNNTLGKAVNVIGEAVRLPGRALVAEDEFFKTIGYRMELNAQAYRQAYAEGLSGDPKTFGNRVAELTQNPPENIRMAAADAALYNTFTNKTGKWGQAFQGIRNDLNIGPLPVGTIILPFVRTPTNIFRYALERSPAAPLVGQWREDIAAGGARADLATARMATGSSIMFLTADWASTGLITGGGPDDPGEREALMRQKWQPYSIRMGDKMVSFSRTDPIGMTLGIAADMQELVNRYDIEPEEMDEINEIIGATIAATAKSSVDKTYMTGISRIVNAIEDPDRYAGDFVAQTASSMVPGISLFGSLEQMTDAETRETMKTLDYVQARIPMLSKNLTLKRDLWGQPMKPQKVYGGAFDSLSPAAVTEAIDSPVDHEMVTLNMDSQRIKKKIEFSTGDKGTSAVNINFREWPEVYEAYQVLAGNELKLRDGLGCKDYLDRVISGKSPDSKFYQTLKDYKGEGDPTKDSREYFISQTIREYRTAARQQIMRDPRFAEFQAHVRKKQRERNVK